MTEEQKVWMTTDLGLAAAALALGHQLIGADSANPNRIVFGFVLHPGLDSLAAAYQSGSLQVDALAFNNGLRRLKGLIRNARENKRMEYDDGNPKHFEPY